MNKKILSILVGMLLILAAMSMLFVGCSSAKTTTPPSIPKTSIPATTPKSTTPTIAPTTTKPTTTTPTTSTPTTTLSLKSLAASTDNISFSVNATQQLKVTAAYTLGTGKDVTTLSIYKSSNDKIATVTNGGLVKGTAVGSANITASYTEGTVTKTITVPVTVK